VVERVEIAYNKESILIENIPEVCKSTYL